VNSRISERNNFITWALAALSALAAFPVVSSCAQDWDVNGSPSSSQWQSPTAPSSAAEQQARPPSLDVPPGTILPIRLNSSMSSEKSKAGQVIAGSLTQEVPLPAGQKIRKGSKVLGKIVAASPSTGHTNAKLSFRFDTLRVGKETIPFTSNLRAMAGYVEVEQAQIPVLSSGEGEVYAWLPTVQIGGDDVFGRGGVVTRWNDSSQVVGESTADGVLGRVNAQPAGGCRGALYGNDAPQALWVFSSDACGVYGLPHVTIAHAGRSDPRGLIVLQSTLGKLSVPSGTGLLLRIDQIGN